MLFGNRIRQLDPLSAVGRSASVKVVQRRQDRLLFRSADARQNATRSTGVDHNGHSIVFGELVHHHRQCLLDQRQFVRFVHRTGDVEQEDDVGLDSLVGLQLLGL